MGEDESTGWRAIRRELPLSEDDLATIERQAELELVLADRLRRRGLDDDGVDAAFAAAAAELEGLPRTVRRRSISMRSPTASPRAVDTDRDPYPSWSGSGPGDEAGAQPG